MVPHSDANKAVLLQSLHAELVESILVLLVAEGYPTAIASLAQTCRRYRSLIYDPIDTYLWREAFLTLFDDPRADNHASTVTSRQFGWGDEFRRRIQAGICFSSQTSSNRPRSAKRYHLRGSFRPFVPSSIPQDAERNICAVNALFSVVSTALAAPPAADITLESDSAHIGTSRSLFDSRTAIPVVPAHQPISSTASRNIVWLRSVLAKGFPPALSARLSAERIDKDWDRTPVAQAFYKLVTYMGFLPIPSSITGLETSELVSATAARSGRRVQNQARTAQTRRDTSDADEKHLDYSIDAQYVRARHLARRRVYDLNYPSRKRHWGPYLPVSNPERDPHSDVDTSDSGDSDYVPDHLPDDNPYGQQPIPGRAKTPDPAELYPDWVYLAAIRLAIEARLKDGGEERLTEYLCDMDALRGGLWQSTGSQLGNSEVQGWDWAGVEGIWRRCVCYLPYDDLHDQNYISKFSDPEDIDEIMVVVPVRLRIVSYEHSPISPGRPTLSIEGEMGGPDWNLNGEVRKTYGTVGVIADGSIRWSLYTSYEDESGPEYRFEAIQIGGVRSAIGVLGMWTLAAYETDGPLGPSWQWRVA